jgi:hypothetical protein
MLGSIVVGEKWSDSDENLNEFEAVGHPWKTVRDLPSYEKSNEGI